MFSPTTQAMLVNGIVLAAVLATDLGPARKIGLKRLARPLLAAALIIPLYAVAPATSGAGLLVEAGGAAAGIAGGLVTLALMRVYRSPKTGKPASSAGWPYAAFWTIVIAARAAFSYGAAHWFTAPFASWAIANQVTQAAVTDGLIFMAVAMVLLRTAGLWALASRLPATAPAAAPAAGLPRAAAGHAA